MRIGDFEILKDTFAWEVRQHRSGVNPKTGKEKQGYSSTYHASLEQACRYVLERGVDDGSVAAVLSSLRRSREAIVAAIRQASGA